MLDVARNEVGVIFLLLHYNLIEGNVLDIWKNILCGRCGYKFAVFLNDIKKHRNCLVWEMESLPAQHF